MFVEVSSNVSVSSSLTSDGSQPPFWLLAFWWAVSGNLSSCSQSCFFPLLPCFILLLRSSRFRPQRLKSFRTCTFSATWAVWGRGQVLGCVAEKDLSIWLLCGGNSEWPLMSAPWPRCTFHAPWYHLEPSLTEVLRRIACYLLISLSAQIWITILTIQLNQVLFNLPNNRNSSAEVFSSPSLSIESMLISLLAF